MEKPRLRIVYNREYKYNPNHYLEVISGNVMMYGLKPLEDHFTGKNEDVFYSHPIYIIQKRPK